MTPVLRHIVIGRPSTPNPPQTQPNPRRGRRACVLFERSGERSASWEQGAARTHAAPILSERPEAADGAAETRLPAALCAQLRRQILYDNFNIMLNHFPEFLTDVYHPSRAAWRALPSAHALSDADWWLQSDVVPDARLRPAHQEVQQRGDPRRAAGVCIMLASLLRTPAGLLLSLNVTRSIMSYCTLPPPYTCAAVIVAASHPRTHSRPSASAPP